jgi:hypothetical protein
MLHSFGEEKKMIGLIFLTICLLMIFTFDTHQKRHHDLLEKDKRK